MLAGALLAGVAQTQAQETGGTKPESTAPKKAGAGTAGTKAAAAPADEKSKTSYSIGVSMGTSLRATGLGADAVSMDRIAQGIRDAMSGKVEMTQADQEIIRTAIASARANLVAKNHAAAATFLAENAKKEDVKTTDSGLQYRVLSPGAGASPTKADEVMVNYKGSLLDGTVFDSSAQHGGPQPLPVGGVIPGWTEALLMMKPGAKWQLFIPPKLAYDERSPSPVIPPGSMLVFDVELVSIKPRTAAPASPAAPAAPHPATPGTK